MLAKAVSIPASWTGPNRPASLPAVVLGATGASANRALPASARPRSIPVRQSWPASCAVAIPSSSCPPVNPRAALLDRPDPTVERTDDPQPSRDLIEGSQPRQRGQRPVGHADPYTPRRTLGRSLLTT